MEELNEEEDWFDQFVRYSRRGFITKDKSPELSNLKKRFDWFLRVHSQDPALIKPYPHIIFNFMDSENIGGFTGKEGDTYYIAISDATELILKDLFLRMLSHPNILTKIGDPTKEHFSQPIPDYFFNIRQMVESGHKGNYSLVKPKDVAREQYAYHLTYLALDYLFFHELSHILFGHIDLLKSGKGLGEDIPYHTDIVDRRNFDMQTLEMDADCSAIGRASEPLMDAHKKRDTIESPHHRNFYNDPYNLLSDLLFAAYNVIRLYGEGNFRDLSLGSATHPEPRIRQMMLSWTMGPVADQHNLDRGKMNSMLVPTIIESERAYTALTGNQIDRESFNPKYIDSNPLPRELRNNWTLNIREKLLPYTYKKLAS
jgi:hypothetical protein